MNTPGRRPGFTLIELITVVMIAGIILGVTASAIGRMQQSTRLQQATTSMASAVSQGWAIAAKRRSPVRITIDTVNKVFRVRDRTTPTNIYLQQYYNKTSDLVLTRIQATDTAIVVFPNGMASTAFSLTLHTPTARRRIDVSRAGMVRISAP